MTREDYMRGGGTQEPPATDKSPSAPFATGILRLSTETGKTGRGYSYEGCLCVQEWLASHVARPTPR